MDNQQVKQFNHYVTIFSLLLKLLDDHIFIYVNNLHQNNLLLKIQGNIT